MKRNQAKRADRLSPEMARAREVILSTSDTRYFYVRTTDRKPIATIAYVVTEAGVQFGAAACSPADVYNHDRAKKIALGRLATRPAQAPFVKDRIKQAILEAYREYTVQPRILNGIEQTIAYYDTSAPTP